MQKSLKILIRLCIVMISMGLIFSLIKLAVLAPWQQKYTKELNVFAWADCIPQEVADQFEKETGIHVNFHYFSSNEELMVKMRTTRGKGYDLMIPSDYAVKILIDENLLRPIDTSKIQNYSIVAPFLCDQYFDPKNGYSIPAFWEIFGLGVDQEALHDYPEVFESPSLKHLLTPAYKVTMTPDMVEAITLASQYLYGKTDPLSKEQLLEIEALLTEQKKWVEAYADYRAKYLISTKNCPVTLLRSSFYYQMKVDFPFIDFLIPEGPIFVSIESFALSKEGKNIEEAYQFMNFLFRKEISLQLIDLCPHFPSILEYSHDQTSYPSFSPILQQILIRNELGFFRHLAHENDMRKLWIYVKKNRTE